MAHYSTCLGGLCIDYFPRVRYDNIISLFRLSVFDLFRLILSPRTLLNRMKSSSFFPAGQREYILSGKRTPATHYIGTPSGILPCERDDFVGTSRKNILSSPLRVAFPCHFAKGPAILGLGRRSRVSQHANNDEEKKLLRSATAYDAARFLSCRGTPTRVASCEPWRGCRSTDARWQQHRH